MKWHKILKKVWNFPDIKTLHQNIESLENTIYNLMQVDKFKPYMEDLSRDLELIRQEKDFESAMEMWNGIANEIDMLMKDSSNARLGMWPNY